MAVPLCLADESDQAPPRSLVAPVAQSAGSGGSSLTSSLSSTTSTTATSSTTAASTTGVSSSTCTNEPSVVGCEPFSDAGAGEAVAAADGSGSISTRSASEVESRGSREVGGTLWGDRVRGAGVGGG